MSGQTFLNGRVTLHAGNCLDVIKTLADSSIDSVVTDPPYALVSITKRFGKPGAAECKVGEGRSGAYARASAGFMGKAWDTGDVAFAVEFWAEVYRVLKPGGHVLAFGGTRTVHRLTCAIEDAGFEIRDMVAWLYGSGFPKSHDVSKGIDRAAGAVREVIGSKLDMPGYHLSGHDGGEAFGHGLASSTRETRLKSSQITAAATEAARQWEGWGTALKPALEPITVGRKPLAGTVAENVLAHGTGALNIDGCRVGTSKADAEFIVKTARPNSAGKNHIGDVMNRPSSPTVSVHAAGRFPANLIHDGSDEVIAAFPETTSGTFSGHRNEPKTKGVYGAFELRDERGHVGDSGSAARFFFSAQHSEDELLLWRAKAILSSCNYELANTADCSSVLSSGAVVSALSDAVISASHGANALCQIASWTAASTSVTPSELRRISEAAIAATLSSEGRFSPASQPEKRILNGSRVSVAEACVQTGIITITVSHWKSDGSAEPVTFSITPVNLGLGVAGCEAKRFHYNAKADSDDRIGSKHPTVKPLDLISYLVRLVTPPGGMVLDPFAGTGTTGEAAWREGFRATLIERETEYCDDIKRRMSLAAAGPDGRRFGIAKAKSASKPVDHGPLFGALLHEGGR